MAKKVNRMSLTAAFIKNLDDVISNYDLVYTDHKDNKEFLAIFSEQMFMYSAVLWEGFLSDLLIAYINKSSNKLKEKIKSSIDASLSENKYKEFIKWELNLSDDLNRKDVERILAPEGQNITVSSAGELKDWAKKYLGDAHSKCIAGLTEQESATINAWYATRNSVAHGSDKAFEKLNTSLRNAKLPNRFKREKNSVVSVGTYLMAIKEKKSRLHHYLEAMKSIAKKITF